MGFVSFIPSKYKHKTSLYGFRVKDLSILGTYPDFSYERFSNCHPPLLQNSQHIGHTSGLEKEEAMQMVGQNNFKHEVST